MDIVFRAWFRATRPVDGHVTAVTLATVIVGVATARVVWSGNVRGRWLSIS